MLMPGPLWLWLSLAWVGSCGSHSLFTCEPIKVHRCLGMPYNMTFFPNMMDHYDQEIAASKMEPFMPLASLQCSPDVHHFLCQAFIPACSEENRVIRPCREKCEAVLSDCEENIRIFGIAWPPELQCNKLKPCGSDGSALPSTTPVTSSSLKRDLGFWCPLQLKTKPGHGSSFLGAQDCAPPCSNMYFRPHDIAFAKSFIGVCSIICLGATLFTFLTFLIDVKRFRYPERPIIFYAVCYSVVSLVYFLGFLIGNGAACTKADHHGAVETVVLGSHSKGCTLLFMLLYFFTMAGIVWWVILTITWFLAAGPKWSCEAIEKKAVWFHTAAWGIPGALTVMLLALNKVEGDNISGVCFVGLYDLDALRQVIQHDERNQEKLKKFMIRIGVFSCLYLVPLVTLLACYTYEQSHRGSWENTWINDRCQEYSIPCSYKASELTRPDLSLFLVKYLMTLVVGISAVFWVSSKKTCSEWAYFFKRNRKRDPISESRRVLQESCEFFLKHNSRVQHKKKHYKPTSHKLKVISKSMGTSTAVSPASTAHQGSSAFGNHELPMRSSLSETSAREHLDRGASGRSSRREREMEREGGERRSKGGSSSKVSSRSESMNRVADGRMTPRSELSDARQATNGQQQQQHPTLNQSHSSILDSAHQKVDKASEESKDPKEI
uniref:Frizzled-6 n=1 Tax=Xiphophorus maculatus TaxID=8083 RepID=A0A3B5QFN6_XIPMA